MTAGADPIGYAVDPNNHSVYVTNANDDTVSVIDSSHCNAKRPGCKDAPPTIAVPGSRSWPVVDPATHTIYVVDQADYDVAVLNDRSCGAEAAAGCRHPARTAPAGSFPNAAATDTRFGTVYIGDPHAFQSPYRITMIDTARCRASDLSRCNRPPRPLAAVGSALSMAADQRTDTIYVATNGPLEVIGAATCNGRTTAGCGHTATVPAGGRSVAVDPSTDTIYALTTNLTAQAMSA